ncbi:hypothetical protein I7I53_08009 [Histoplasma capsulatum var. duboisii H88]|uniref:Uncharacterized protein n=1 Tax=Ajellomyces capsulatus (strain H88) TaxID=544711 RepID=A0A8A1LFS3_AJEC8|nr:hypothetical protein I7I53_08009 [Histoplasma capsulatum var. duboisii H88]
MNQPFKRKQGDSQTLIITTKPNDNQKPEIQNRRPARNLILSPPTMNSFYGYVSLLSFRLTGVIHASRRR